MPFKKDKSRNDIAVGKKGNWFSSVKKAFSPDSKKKKSQKVRSKPSEDENSAEPDSTIIVPEPLPPHEETSLTEVEDTEISVADSEAVAIATEDEIIFESSPEVVTSPVVEDDVAAVKIQTAFRGYQAMNCNNTDKASTRKGSGRLEEEGYEVRRPELESIDIVVAETCELNIVADYSQPLDENTEVPISTIESAVSGEHGGEKSFQVSTANELKGGDPTTSKQSKG